MKFRDYYDILGVKENASADEIKRAYRKKARQFHPDVSKEADAEEKFKLVGEAYEVLRDPARRQEFDQLKKYGYRGGDDFRGGGNWQRQAGANNYSGDFSDFFNAIFGAAGAGAGVAGGGANTGFGGGFGAGFGQGSHHSYSGPQSRSRAGDDIRLRVRVSLEQAYQGGKTTIKVPAKNGASVRSLSMTIPSGVTDGQQLRLRGQGTVAGGRAGDLIVTIEIKPHDVFEVDGSDILLRLPVTPLESVQGVTVSVPTPGGPVSVKVPPGTESGTRLRLRGRGLPSDSPGDQYVTVQITLPADLSDRQRELLEAFDATVDEDLRSRMWGPAEVD